jgi:vancomycin resistance protein YoaR
MDIKKKSKTREEKPKTKFSSELSGLSKSTAVVVGLVWVFVLFVATLSLIYSAVYAHVTFPGAQLSQKDASNLSRHDVSTMVEKRVETVSAQKWQLTYKDKKVEATASDLGFSFDPEETTTQIWNFGRTENFFVNFKDQVVGLLWGRNFSPTENVSTATLSDFADTKLSDFQEKSQNATLVLKDGAIHIEADKSGRVIDTALLASDVQNQIAKGSIDEIQILTYAKTPTVTNNIARASRQKIVDLIKTPIKLSYESKTWTLDSSDIGSWITPIAAEVQSGNTSQKPATDGVITLSKDGAALTFPNSPQKDFVLTETSKEITSLVEMTANQDIPLNIREFVNRQLGLDKNIFASEPAILAIAIDKSKLDATFDPITKKIDVPGKNVRLAFQDGKMTVLEKSEDGRGVDREDALDKILAAVNDGGSHDISLVVNTIPAKVTENNYDKLGIKELLATGDSNFKGSPKNRQHNIHTAASHFEGVLVAPGDEFSFVSYLGDVDASTGYLPELVIKGNKITPEYGGGVCQVSSTLFRAAVYAGLEITERQNHSFVVSYYGTPGMDATIYIPHPDLKFVNNTPGYILMQPRFDGTHLSFDIFGTTDGRKVETQGPYIYARSAGNAMKATWTQIVTTASGETKTKVFKSSYKPVTDFVHTN